MKKENNGNQPPMVLVEWLDAWSDTKTVEPDNDYFTAAWPSFTAGYLQRKTAEVVVVSLTWCRDHPHDDGPAGFRHTICIPRGMVRKITTLRLG